MNLKESSKFISWALGLALAMVPGHLPADSLYVGASTWRAKWNVGMADQLSENAAKGAIPASLIAQGALRAAFQNAGAFTTLFLNGSSNTNINNYGIFGSYGFGSGWGISLSASAGKTGFDSTRTIYFQSSFAGSGSVLATNVTDPVIASRKDIDLVLSRRIGDSAFSWFAGVKAQHWDYATRNDPAFGPAFQNTSTFGNALGAAAYTFDYRTRAYGPAAGLMYTHVFTPMHSLVAQVAAIHLDGVLSLNETNITRTTTQTASSTEFLGSTGIFRDRITDRLWMPGYTVKVDYRLSFERVVFRFGVFYQEMKMQSRKAHDDALTILYTDPSTLSASFGASVIPLPATPTRLQPEFSVNGARDIFKGISFSAAMKVF